MAEKWLEGAIIENRQWTEDLFSLRIAAGPFDFIPGQFIKLALDLDGERVARPYSLINPPGTAEAECYLTLVPKGPLSHVLQTLQPGDRVLVSQPAAGFFTLNEVPEGDSLWLLATGTGLGPYLSILQTETPWRRFQRIHLAHSVRFAAELNYQDLIQTWQRKYPDQFHYQPIVTRELVDGALNQRLPALIENALLEQSLNDKLDGRAQVMLCGNPDMVTDCLATLKTLGLEKNLRRKPGQVTVERYW